MQKKFCRESDAARDNTYHHFRLWLHVTFEGGKPTEEQVADMMAADATIGTSGNPSETPPVQPSPPPDTFSSLSRNHNID